MAEEQKIGISGGNNQLLPNATHAEQHIHYHGGDEGGAANRAKTLVILGAGADAAVGLPVSSQLIPGIVDWLGSDEGKAIEEALRKRLKRLTFRFDKFVEDAIDRLSHDLDRERDTICANVQLELAQMVSRSRISSARWATLLSASSRRYLT